MLQYWYSYLDPYAKQIKVHLMLLRMPHVTEQENWQKKLANCCDSPNSPKFFPLQSFLLYGISLSTKWNEIMSHHLCITVAIPWNFSKAEKFMFGNNLYVVFYTFDDIQHVCYINQWCFFSKSICYIAIVQQLFCN